MKKNILLALLAFAQTSLFAVVVIKLTNKTNQPIVIEAIKPAVGWFQKPVVTEQIATLAPYTPKSVQKAAEDDCVPCSEDRPCKRKITLESNQTLQVRQGSSTLTLQASEMDNKAKYNIRRSWLGLKLERKQSKQGE